MLSAPPPSVCRKVRLSPLGRWEYVSRKVRLLLATGLTGLLSVAWVVGPGTAVFAVERTVTNTARIICNVGAWSSATVPPIELYGLFAACSFDPTVEMFPPGAVDVPQAGVYSTWAGTTLGWPRLDPDGSTWHSAFACDDEFIGTTLYVGPGVTTPEGLELDAGQLWMTTDTQTTDCGGAVKTTPSGCVANSNPGDLGLMGNMDAAQVHLTQFASGYSSAPFCYTVGGTYREGGLSWAGLFGSRTLAAQSPDVWPIDHMTNSVVGDPAPVSACMSAFVQIFENGVWLDPNDVPETRVLSPAATVTVRVDWIGGVGENAALEPGFSMAGMGFAQRIQQGPWVPIPNSAWTGTVGALGGSYVTRFTTDISASITSTIELADLGFRCNDPAVPGFRYWLFGLSWGDDENGRRACALLRIDYPTASQTGVTPAGESVRYSYEMGTEEALDDIVSLEWRFDSSIVVIADYFDVDGVARGIGYVPASGDTGYFDVVFPVAADWSVPVIWCEDSEGSVRMSFNGGNLDPVTPTGESCFAAADLGLNPSSWIPGAFRIGVCTVRFLFVPSEGFVGDWATDQRETLSNVPPFSFGVALIDFGADLSAEVVDPSGTGCFDVGIPVAGVDDSAMCVGAGISTSGGQRSLIAVFVIVPLVLGLLAQGFSMLRSK